jgi:hypothetical protein
MGKARGNPFRICIVDSPKADTFTITMEGERQ